MVSLSLSLERERCVISELFYNYGSFWHNILAVAGFVLSGLVHSRTCTCLGIIIILDTHLLTAILMMILLFREPRGFGFVKYRYAEDAAKAMKLKKRHWPQKPSKNTSLEVCQGHVLGPSVADLAIQVEWEKRFSSFAMDVYLCAYFVLII
ncbi:hypothetical protein F2Q68_00022416 [Brassica cretica]|uniref:RRM domain-containing protein n=1 Tax=Brassica cretica TaxID=69181 RepID=A0A8S9G1V3_BRACR|nr:hypothetical protein F2Q68_00022416 [Brassica cretica]